MSIPKIIHQTWKDETIPDSMKNYVKSWKTLHPEYKYMFWTDITIRDFIKNYYPWFLIYFDSYPHQIMRVDAFRFFVLHRYGGIYADLDMECYKSIDTLLSDASCLLFLEWKGSVSNAIMCSIPNHPFLEYCFKALIQNHSSSGPNTVAWKVTGPKFLTNSLKEYTEMGNSDYKIYPNYYYFPIPWHKPLGDQSGQSVKYPNSYGAHHWQGTWWQPQPLIAANSIKARLSCVLAIVFVLIMVVIKGVQS